MLLPGNSNLAYDFDMFDDELQKSYKKKEANPGVKIKKSSIAKTGNMFKIMLGCTASVIIAYTIITSKATLSELSSKVNVETSQLALAERENIRLQTMLDNMVSLSKVEEYAKEELGLQKISSAKEKHITLNTEDMTEIADNGKSKWYEVVNKGIFNIKEYLGF